MNRLVFKPLKASSCFAVVSSLVLMQSVAFANSDGESYWNGVYSEKVHTSPENVNIEKISITPSKDGKLKVEAWLSGLGKNKKEWIFIGETLSEEYLDLDAFPKCLLDTVVASFPQGRHNPTMLITRGSMQNTHLKYVNVTCYLRDHNDNWGYVKRRLFRESKSAK